MSRVCKIFLSIRYCHKIGKKTINKEINTNELRFCIKHRYLFHKGKDCVLLQIVVEMLVHSIIQAETVSRHTTKSVRCGQRNAKSVVTFRATQLRHSSRMYQLTFIDRLVT